MIALANEAPTDTGLLLYETPSPPPPEAFRWFERIAVDVRRMPVAGDDGWLLDLRHRVWGHAQIASHRHITVPDVPGTARCGPGAARSAVSMTVTRSRGDVYHGRKQLLRWLSFALSSAGYCAYDCAAQHVWCRDSLDAEFEHEAPLDVSSLFMIHAVHGPACDAVHWLHTHGLAEAGGFDFDILHPALELVRWNRDPLRALATNILAGRVPHDALRYELGAPGGEVSLVPAAEFMRNARRRERRVREGPENHERRRSIVCDPRMGRMALPPQPSTFLTRYDHTAHSFLRPEELERREATRAHCTLLRFHDLRDDLQPLDPVALVRLSVLPGAPGAPDTPGMARSEWFRFHEGPPGTLDAFVDASEEPIHVSPADGPHDPASRTWRSMTDLVDWRIETREGTLTPTSGCELRRLTEIARESRRAQTTAAGRCQVRRQGVQGP